MLKLRGAVTCLKFLAKSAGPGSGSAQGFLPYVELSILLAPTFSHIFPRVISLSFSALMSVLHGRSGQVWTCGFWALLR